MIYRAFLTVILSLLCLCRAEAQHSFHGSVKDDFDLPVAFATIYIEDLRSGIAANEEGRFILQFSSDSLQQEYNLIISSLGYETRRIVFMPSQPENITNIVLNEKLYKVPQVVRRASDEDPAYGIMRQVIARAPYYRNVVQSYTARVYLKGTMQLRRLGALASAAIKREQRKQLKDFSYIEETVNEIRYIAPATYHQKVLSENKQATIDLKQLGIPEDLTLGMLNLNVYSQAPQMPLHANALSNYRFKYEGEEENEGRYIVKIAVHPRKPSDDLFTGWLYIVRETWNVQALDLSLTTKLFYARAKQTYRFVDGDVLLPVVYTVDGDVDAFGVKADGHFAASIAYSDVKQNALEMPADQSTEPLKRNDQMRKVRSKVEKEVRKTNRNLAKQKGEDPLEIRSTYNVIRDSVKKQRDTSYWASLRPVPLLPEEIETLKKADSIARRVQTPESIKDAKNSAWTGIIAGRTYQADSTWKIGFSGLINPVMFSFSAVDGYGYGASLKAKKDWNKGRQTLQMQATASWAFAREALNWEASAEGQYSPMLRAGWKVSLGNRTYDFAGNKGVGTAVNTWSSLIFHVNPSRFYNNRYIHLSHNIDIANGLVLSANLNLENRVKEHNRSEQAWLYKNTRTYAPNIPANNYVLADTNLISSHSSTAIELSLEWTPQYYYRVVDGRKRMANSAYPTFSLNYRKGFKMLGGDTDYDYLQFGVRQNIDFGYHNLLSYRIDAGVFLQKACLYFADYQFIRTNHSGVASNGSVQSFQLRSTYDIATPREFLVYHLRYAAPRILLKRLNILRNPMIRENFYCSILLLGRRHAYWEAGYGLSNIYGLIDLGIFTGFSNFKFDSWGLRATIPLDTFYY